MATDKDILGRVYRQQLELYDRENDAAQENLAAATKRYQEASTDWHDAVTHAGRAEGQRNALLALMEKEGITGGSE